MAGTVSKVRAVINCAGGKARQGMIDGCWRRNLPCSVVAVRIPAIVVVFQTSPYKVLRPSAVFMGLLYIPKFRGISVKIIKESVNRVEKITYHRWHVLPEAVVAMAPR